MCFAHGQCQIAIRLLMLPMLLGLQECAPHMNCLLKWDLNNFLSRIASNDLPDLCLRSIWDYRFEPLPLARIEYFEYNILF
jgi:hypothetical protein